MTLDQQAAEMVGNDALEQLQRLSEEATPGDWGVYHREPRRGVFGEVPADYIHAGPEPRDDTGLNVLFRAYTTHGYDGVAERAANAAFAAAAVNYVRSLLQARQP